MSNTQLINVSNYNTDRMIFSVPTAGTVPSNGPTITYQRINISSKNEDGSVGELVMPTTRLFSFGVSENISPDNGSVNGYTFPICLWNKDGATAEEIAFTKTFEDIIEKCACHILDTKEELDLYDLERSELKKLSPLYWKKEQKMVNGKKTMAVVEGSGPTLYSKILYSKKNEKFLTNFYDCNDQPLNPLDLQAKYCYATSVIKIESIFIGNKISVQVKLYESVIEPIAVGMKRLITSRPVSCPTMEIKTTVPVVSDANNDCTNEDGGSLDGEEVQVAPPVALLLEKKKVPIKKKA